jgi:phasin family protein
MTFKSDQFADIHRKNMEAAMRLAQLSIDNSQRIMGLQAALAKALFESSMANAKESTSVKSPQDLLKLRTEYVQDTTQKVVEVAQQVAEIGNQSRAEFSQLLTEQLAAGNKDLADSMQGFMKNLPAGLPNVMQAMEQAMTTANAAFDQISKASASAISSVSSMAKKATAGTSSSSKKK